MLRGIWSGRAKSSELSRLVPQLVLALLLVLACGSGSASAARFSAIAVDARSGEVLFTQDADGPRYPASLTKMMTLYLLFEDLRAGRIKLDSQFTVSAYAATRPPSKLGLKAGQTILVEHCIKALVTKSANDVAVVVAEGLEGSERAFGARMTSKARALGMTRTTFRNPHGLPDPGQVTTARDMATLALRLQRDFPERYNYFGLRSFTYKGRAHRNHNRLLGRVKGMDGLKTGYIRASGFNLAASAERDGKRLVAVVMGGNTARSRDKYMASMLEQQFKSPKLKGSGALVAKAADPTKAGRAATAKFVSAPLPKEKPEIAVARFNEEAQNGRSQGEGDKDETEKVTAASAAIPAAAGATLASMILQEVMAESVPVEHRAEVAPVEPPAAQPVAAAPVAALPEAIPVDAPTEVAPVDPAASLERGTVKSDLLPVGSEPEPEARSEEPAPEEATSWTIQVGAFPTREGAQNRLDMAKEASVKLLKDKSGFVVTHAKASRIVYRARFSGFTEESARDACKALNRKGVGCLPLAPRS